MHTGMQKSKQADRYWEVIRGGRQTQVDSGRERQNSTGGEAERGKQLQGREAGSEGGAGKSSLPMEAVV
jgi:hypothetical protein